MKVLFRHDRNATFMNLQWWLCWPAANTLNTVNKKAERMQGSDDGALQNVIFWT